MAQLHFFITVVDRSFDTLRSGTFLLQENTDKHKPFPVPKKMRDPAQVAHYYFETYSVVSILPFDYQSCICDANFSRFFNLRKKNKLW